VIHSLRHTFGTRLGESGADAFMIMKLMGHSSVTVSQKYVHPTPENLERAMKRLEARNQDMKRKEVPTISPTVKSEGV
jgi:site-specific recombinase XerD